ncbi:hypothetical protein [Neisseria sp.]
MNCVDDNIDAAVPVQVKLGLQTMRKQPVSLGRHARAGGHPEGGVSESV